MEYKTNINELKVGQPAFNTSLLVMGMIVKIYDMDENGKHSIMVKLEDGRANIWYDNVAPFKATIVYECLQEVKNDVINYASAIQKINDIIGSF